MVPNTVELGTFMLKVMRVVGRRPQLIRLPRPRTTPRPAAHHVSVRFKALRQQLNFLRCEDL